ncbi:MAG: collagenase [Gammaproteobacteria bacterium]|nr:collagenase [Gammaproteobacteria bacterium]
MAVEDKLRIIAVPRDKGVSRSRRTRQAPPPRLLDPKERRVFDIAFSHGHGAPVLAEEEECDDDAFATKTGDDLVEHIRTTSSRCINRLFSTAASRFAAFGKQNMIDVAEAATPLAVAYDGTNSSNIQELFLFLRGGFYVEFYEGDELDWTEPDEDIADAVVGALDAFTDNAHFYDETEAHLAHAMEEAATLMDSSWQMARYLPETKSWLERWDAALADTRGGANVIQSFYVLLFGGHWNQAFVDATAEDHELVRILRDRALDDWMLDTDLEILAANAGRELARFSQYDDAPIHADVRDGIKSILERYDMVGEGRTIWIATASVAVYHDDCEVYGICGFEAELEALVLSIRHECSDSVTIRAQDLDAAQLDESCAVMADGERYFHVRLGTGRTPVADDHNTSLEVVVFADSTEYQTYSGLFFGNDTNNGGIYLEGDPSDPDNTARFIAFVATWLEDRPVWNLAHEQVHYLDGRYNFRGSFWDYGIDTHHTVWWLEGFAEYFSLGNHNPRAVDVGRDGDLKLSEVFPVIYSDGVTRVYRWGYLAVRFMFERHHDDVDAMLAYFREGDYEGYLGHLDDGIGTAYDAEWAAWLLDVPSTGDGLELIELPDRLSVDEGSSSTYEVALAWEPSAEVEVAIAAEDANIGVSPTRVAFSPQDWNSGKTVQVEAYEDDNGVHETPVLVHTASGGGYDGARASLAVSVRDSALEISFVDASAAAAEGGTAVLRVAIDRPLESSTTFGYRLGRDDDPETFDADADDHGGGDGEATIPAGETETRIEIPIVDDEEIEPPRETLAVSLDPSTILNFAQGSIRAAVVIEEGVCDRTPGVRDALRRDGPCEAVTAEDLAVRTVLNLSGALPGELRTGDLQGLIRVTELKLSDNGLTTLPSGAFADMNELWGLFANGNEIEELPERPFEGPADFKWLYLSDNNLSELPAGVFAGHGELIEVDLHDNPGVPFPLTLEWSRLQAFTVAATVREGAPFDMQADVSVVGGTLSADAVTVPAGATTSDPLTITPDGSGPVRVSFASAPELPDDECYGGVPCFHGLEAAAGGDLVIVGDAVGFARVPTSYALPAAVESRIALADLFPDIAANALSYTATSSDPSILEVRIEGDLLVLFARAAPGTVVVTVTLAEPGVSTILDLSVTVAEPTVASIPYFPSASDASGRIGVMRVVNRSERASVLTIIVFNGEGASVGSLVLSVGEDAVVQLDSRDMDAGESAKGLVGGTGSGEGPWRLDVAHLPDVEVLTYVRMPDGLLASVHDLVARGGEIYRVGLFNPGSDTSVESLLKLANPTPHAAAATIRGTDDDGAEGGAVNADIPALGVLTVSADELETGTAPALSGSLGDGTGRWRLDIEAPGDIQVMSLLSHSTGRLANLSGGPSNRTGNAHFVPLFPSAADALGREGLVRVINRGDTEAVATIAAFDETDRAYDSPTLTVAANGATYIDSDDLEQGNEERGLSGGIGAGEGDWRLELTSEDYIEVLSYVRSSDGFLVPMQDMVPPAEDGYHVPMFNPGADTDAVSRLRLVNAGDETANVTIRGVDDAGQSSSLAGTSLAAGAAESFTAAELEAGVAGLDGSLGTGEGKWRLIVGSDQPITVMNLMENSAGQLSNLSAGPTTGRASGVHAIVIYDEDIYKDDDFAVFRGVTEPALPIPWVVSGNGPRFDGIRISADGSVRADIDPAGVVVDSSIRYVFTFEWGDDVLNVVHTGDIVDVGFTPSNAAAVAAFHDLLVDDTAGRVILSDDPDIDPTPDP